MGTKPYLLLTINKKQKTNERERKCTERQTGNLFVDLNEQLIERESYDEFTLVTVKDKGTFIAFGNATLTEFTTKENCKQMIDKRAWTLIAAWTMLLNSVTQLSEKYYIKHESTFQALPAV